jgi:hypothetical protein
MKGRKPRTEEVGMKKGKKLDDGKSGEIKW